jgi:hypothetical protein
MTPDPDTQAAPPKPAVKEDPRFAITPLAFLCFADGLVKPRPASEGGDPRWSCILLFKEEAMQTANWQAMRKAVMAAIIEKWGQARAGDEKFIKSLRMPFRNAADKDYDGFDQGKVYISPWKSGDQERPGIIDPWGATLPVSDIFSGQIVRGGVRAFGYENSGNKGVGFGLQHIQLVKADMPRLDGRRTAAEMFAGTDNSELEALGIDVNNPSGSLSDDIPF